jgi:hypothetical protein
MRLDELEAIARAATPDERHERVVAAFPGGLTPDQFDLLTLHSADADGRLDPPSIADWWTAISLQMRLYMRGWIERRGTGRMYERTGPWFITEAGRERLRTALAAFDEMEGK